MSSIDYLLLDHILLTSDVNSVERMCENYLVGFMKTTYVVISKSPDIGINVTSN